MRDYTRPLTFLLTGTGTSDINNTRALLEDYIFGTTTDEIDVKVIVPFAGKTSKGMTDALKVLSEWGITGKDFIPVVEPDSGHRSIALAEDTVQVDQGDSTSAALHLLGEANSEGRETAFISLFAEGSGRDIDDLEAAKACEGLITLNLCEGLIDSFPGYESETDRTIREALQEAYAEQEAAKEAAEKPARAPRKAAAKKAATPRKAAASKALVSEDVPLTEEAVKAPVAPHVHKFVWADDGIGHSGSFCACGKEEPDKELTGTQRLVAEAVQREAEKKAAKIELSGTIVAAKSELPKDLEPAKPVAPVVDVWQDVAANVPAMSGTHISVAKEDLVQLNAGMQKMAEGFSTVLDAYNRMLKEQ